MNVDRAAPSGRRGDLCFTLLLSLMPVVFLANILFTDQVLVGDNLARDYPWFAYADEELLQRPTNGRIDPLHQFYAHRVIAARIAEAGRLPLWNPYFLAGTPFLATESQAGLFYPLNLIYAVIDPLRGFGVSAYIHLVLAGVFMYAYLRSIGLNRLSGFVGATSFQFSGYFLINLMWLPRVWTATWAPLLFFGLERYWREERWGYALLMAVGMAMSLLAGMMGVVVYVAFGLLLYLIFRAWQSWDEDGWRRTARKTVIVAVGGGLGILLASVQVVPTYEALPYLERASLSYEETWDTGRPVAALATAVLPESLANYWRPNLYGGILTLVLATWAVVFDRNKQVLFFAALAVLALCLFVNVPEFLYRVLYVIPVFRFVRLVEVKVVYAFCLSVLAGWGFSSVVGEPKLATRGWMRVMSLALMVVGLVALAASGILGLMGAGIGSVDLPSFPGV
ncbi:MAG TPA: YfhO family protein, partial [Anaerolineae bacterium]|nr:YfhO family protein [Anaerolineae bacterium]